MRKAPVFLSETRISTVTVAIKVGATLIARFTLLSTYERKLVAASFACD